MRKIQRGRRKYSKFKGGGAATFLPLFPCCSVPGDLVRVLIAPRDIQCFSGIPYIITDSICVNDFIVSATTCLTGNLAVSAAVNSSVVTEADMVAISK